MAFIHEGSCECIKSELDLFAVPATQTSMESSTYVEYHPISSLTDGAPIEFDVSSSGEDYVDLNNTLLYVKLKVVKGNGTAIGVGEKVSLVNNTLHSLFSHVDVDLNGTRVTDSSNTNAYRAYLENLLSFDSGAKKTQLSCELFYKDESGEMDDCDPTLANANAGLVKRAAFINGGKPVELIGRIHTDICLQSRFMLNEVNARFKLTRSKDSFCLMTSEDESYKVIILSAVLHIRKVKVSPSVYLSHAKVLESGMAKYPIQRVICKAFTVPAGYLDFVQEKLFSGQLPTRLILACLDNRAFNGDYKQNPFNFQHFNASELTVFLDGQQHSIKPLVMNFSENLTVNAYLNLFTALGKFNQDEGNDITRQDFNNGYTIYAFDFTPDMSENTSFNLTRSGSVRVSMKFGTALAKTITVLAYAEFQNIIELDISRAVVFDYGS